LKLERRHHISTAARLEPGDLRVYAENWLPEAPTSLDGQGITQASGTISATGSSDGTTPRNGSSAAPSPDGYDGTSSGSISLVVPPDRQQHRVGCHYPRHFRACCAQHLGAQRQLEFGTLRSLLPHHRAITQTASTSLNIKALNVAADSSAVLANTGTDRTAGQHLVGNNAGVNYDFDVYNSTNGLSLTHDVTSAGGVRIVIAQGGGSSGALALGNYNAYATGDIYLAALGVTQGSTATIDANHAGAPARR